MAQITNPILRGFNPDPSICRVGDDYYIATSTFEWFPGVQIHHSRDLCHWELITHPLTRTSQLDMLGVQSSNGIWAPCLTYDQGTFYLIYTNVRNNIVQKDAPNYLVTAKDIMGPWSEPIYLNRSGFDPSLFHDEDGRKWLVNMRWTLRPGLSPFAAIVLQEYDPAKEKLVGEIRDIFLGTEIGFTEGPHLYKRNGYYYLMVAEGGTGYDHAVTLARSKDLFGPYEVHPENPILTSKGSDMHEVLQKAGHASICDTTWGDTILVHLCGRPYPGTNRCVLGRETSIQVMEWGEDDWLYLKGGGNWPKWQVELPDLPGEDIEKTPTLYDFRHQRLDIHFNTLREPMTEKMASYSARPGYLRLYGGESLESPFHQSLIARRQQHHDYVAETLLSFNPTNPNHQAGLVLYYNLISYYYLRVAYEPALGGKILGIIASQNMDTKESLAYTDSVVIEGHEEVYLRAVVTMDKLQFMYSIDGATYQNIGKVYDVTTLSDDYVTEYEYAFTGAFVGICCQDLAYGGHSADFAYFKYDPISD